MSSRFARLSLISMGTFPCSLRAYRRSAGERSWLSIGVDLMISSAIAMSIFAAGLLKCSFNGLNLSFNKSVRLGEMRAGRCVVELPLLAESSVFNAAILTAVVAVDCRRDTLLGDYLLRQSDDGLAGHCSSHFLEKGGLGVVVGDDQVISISYRK